jgi:membrane protein required for colicin V production
MDSLPVNFIDLVIIAILLISGGLAFMRGFVHEVLAVAAWVGAALATLYGLPALRGIARAHISSTFIADLATGAAIFLVSLLVFALVTKAISKRVRESALNSVDSSLGFIFGLLRGAVIVCLAYMLADWVIGRDPQPEWLAQAKAKPLMERGARMIRSIAPDELGLAEEKTKEAAGSAQDLMEMQRAYRNLTSPQPRKADERGRDGTYSPGERRDMDRLFQNHQ